MKINSDINTDESGLFKMRANSVKKLKAKCVDGKIELPEDIARKIGLYENAEFRVEVDGDKIQLYPNIHSLSRVYIETTSLCNLKCHTCIRNTWDEELGNMDIKVFDKIMDDLKEFDSLQSVMFGGFGEPTCHRDFLYMAGRAKALGVKVEITTNGTLLNEDMQRALMDIGVDKIWVSFDGTSQEKFEDIREGAKFSRVVENLKGLKLLNRAGKHKIEVGIAFVAMKSNIDELNNINSLARQVGANFISISNVIPYDKHMQKEVLYSETLGQYIDELNFNDITLSLSRMDINKDTKDILFNLIKNNRSTFNSSNFFNGKSRTCRFIDNRCTFIRWDGGVSPCMGLLHSYKTYLTDYERKLDAYILGNIMDSSLKEIWGSDIYHDYREKVSEFDFAPCQVCGGCDSLESNREDCYNSQYPSCGACMWGYGVIQCP